MPLKVPLGAHKGTFKKGVIMTNYDSDHPFDSTEIEWRPIRGFPQYEISKAGDVRNIKTGHILDFHIFHGEWHVRLYDRSKHSTRIKSLSKLIYEAFVEVPDYRYTIVYKDGDSYNDDLNNLSAKPYYRNDCFKAKPVDEYSIDGQLIKTWHSGLSAAKNYGIKPVGIYRCCNGKKPSAGNKVWRWHKEPLDKYKLPVIEPLYPDEEFRRIPDTYAEVSNYGRVRNTRKEGKFYKIRPNGTVRIMTNGKVMQKQVYSLVANAFLPNMFGYTRVMFKDNNKKNCRADNLMWMTDFYLD